jgi:hypothetical protein
MADLSKPQFLKVKYRGSEEEWLAAYCIIQQTVRKSLEHRQMVLAN